jgi:hypothetical protein
MRLLYWLPDIIIPPPLRVVDLAVDGYHLGMCLNALADLGVADALKDGPLTAAEIATAVGMPQMVSNITPNFLYRIEWF